MQLLIVDPNPVDQSELKLVVANFCLKSDLIFEVASVEKGIEIVKNQSIDIVFLSLNLCDKEALRIWRSIRGKHMKVVLMTSMQICGDKKSLFEIIEKPVKSEVVRQIVLQYRLEISAALKKTKQFASAQNNQIAIKSNEETRLIAVSEILRCQSDSNYTEIYLVNGDKIVSSKTLKSYERLLVDYGFLRVHQSHLVAKKGIKKIMHNSRTEIMLNNGEVIAVSRRKKEILMEAVNLV